MNLKQSNLSKSVMKATSGVLAALSILSNSAFAASLNEPKNQNSKLPYIVAGAATTGFIVASGIALWCVSKTDKPKIFVDYKDSLDTINGIKDKKSLYYIVNISEEFLEGKINKDDTKEFQCKFRKIKEIIDEIDEKDEDLFRSFKAALVEDLKSIVDNILEGTKVSTTGKVTEFASKIEEKVLAKEAENKPVKNEVDDSKINANEVNESKFNEIKVNESKTDEKTVEKEEPDVNEEYKQALNGFNAGIEKDLESKCWNGITDEEKMSILKTKSANLCGIISQYDNPEALLVGKFQNMHNLTTFEEMYHWIISIDDGIKNFDEFYEGCNMAVKDEISSSIGSFRKLAEFLFMENSKASELAEEK